MGLSAPRKAAKCRRSKASTRSPAAMPRLVSSWATPPAGHRLAGASGRGLSGRAVAARIHEGIVWCARDRRTLLDKLSALLLSLQGSGPLTVVADAYCAAAKFARSLLSGVTTWSRARAPMPRPISRLRPDVLASRVAGDAASTAPKPICRTGFASESNSSKLPVRFTANRALPCAVSAMIWSGVLCSALCLGKPPHSR